MMSRRKSMGIFQVLMLGTAGILLTGCMARHSLLRLGLLIPALLVLLIVLRDQPQERSQA